MQEWRLYIRLGVKERITLIYYNNGHFTLLPHISLHFSTQGTLLTARLYPADLCQPVNSDGYTLLMLATLHNHEALLQELVVKMETECSINYKLMKVCVCLCDK